MEEKKRSRRRRWRGERRSLGDEPKSPPLPDEELPERSPPAEVPRHLREIPCDVFDAEEQPDLVVAGLAQDLPREPEALLGRGVPESAAELGGRDVLVPEEVGDE